MSFDKNPPKAYSPWRPNADFTKFFTDLKKRRITSHESEPMVRISNRPPPQKGGKTAPCSAKTKHNYSSPSEILVNTALDQTGAITARVSNSTVRSGKKAGRHRRPAHPGHKKPKKPKKKSALLPQKKKKKKTKKSSPSRLERRLREARL